MINPLQIVRNMGLRYVLFRAWYELLRRTGIQQLSYPTTIKTSGKISLTDWRRSKPPFFFGNRQAIGDIPLSSEQKKMLSDTAIEIKAGKIRFFSGPVFDLGITYNWKSNPQTNYTYTENVHWTKIEDFSKKAGDIKYVWEKSRFCYLYTIIRDDHQQKSDSASFVFNEIVSWIVNNPLNLGPHFKCSQEIALRVLNWFFALYFYADSPALTEEVFRQVVLSIYGQVLHVEKNLQFSQIAVRNNHTITESLVLYTAGMLCPWCKEAVRWRSLGKSVWSGKHCFRYSPMVPIFSTHLIISGLSCSYILGHFRWPRNRVMLLVRMFWIDLLS